MDYLKKIEEAQTLKAYYDNESRIVEQMLGCDKSEGEILEFKTRLLALKLASKDYVDRWNERPKFYPDMEGKNIAFATEIYPFIAGVHSSLSACEDGDFLMEQIDFLSALSVTRMAKEAIDEFGIEDRIVEKVVNSVVHTLESVVETGLNDRTGEYQNPSTGTVATAKILMRYPDRLQSMTDEVTQKIFKNDRDNQKGINNLKRTGVNHYTYTANKKSGSGFFVMSTNIQDANDAVHIEKDFTYFDWAVMEAVATLYQHALDSKAVVNGEILLDIKSIDKMLKHGDSRMTKKKMDTIETSDIYLSIKKLLGNHVMISEDNETYEDDLINGAFVVDSGKVCLHVKRMPVLLEFAQKSSRGYVENVEVGKLKLKSVKYTTEHITIYRYLLQRVKEIYDSYFIDANHLNPTATNSIPLNNLIDALYPDLYNQYGDPVGKKRDIQESINKIFKEMIGLGMITGVRSNIRKKDGSLSYELERKLSTP